MKRSIIALLVGGLVFGTVFAVAAALDVDAGTIQAGGDVDLVCDPDGVDVFIGDEYSEGHDAYVVTGVIVSGIHENCDGGTIKVTFTDNDKFVIEEKILGDIGTEATLTPSGTIKVEDLGDIHVLISSSYQP